MEIVVHVDAGDNAACNLRCAGDAHYCNRYPGCAAGVFHKVLDWATPQPVERQIIREDRKRSAQGGYSHTRIVAGPDPQSTVEEVELHCETLTFESLLKTAPVDKVLKTAPLPPPADVQRADH